MYGELRAIHQGFRLGFGLLQKEISTHFGPCHGKDTIHLRSSADRYPSVGQRAQKTHVEGFGREIDFPASSGTVREMHQVAFRLYFE